MLRRLNWWRVISQRSLAMGCYNIKRLLATRKMHSDSYDVSDLLFDSSRYSGPDEWIFHDENWIRVRYRWEHRRMVAAGVQPEVTDNRQEPTSEGEFSQDGTIRFLGKTKTDDDWLYLYLDPEKYAWDDYCWKLRDRRETRFREFQLGFRYQDFYNRYRYRFEKDHVYFDKVVKGRFHNEFGSAPFRMELGVWYDVEIHAYKNRFKCYINGSVVLDDFDFDENFRSGSIAIILWEKNGVTDIRAAVGPIGVYRLVPSK